MFGLDCQYRREDCTLFDFDIEEFICFAHFKRMCQLPVDCSVSWDKESWLGFIDQHCLLKLNILQVENDKNWRYLANQQYDAFA